MKKNALLLASLCWLLGTASASALSYTLLNNQLTACDTILSADTSDYPAVLISELQSLYDYALAVRSDATVTQRTINACYRLLKGKTDEVAAAKGEAYDTQHVVSSYDTDRGFVHPGLLHTQEDLDRICQQIAEGDTFVTAAYAMLTSNEWAQSSRATAAETTVNRGGDDENYINASRAACGAYMNALRWHISGETAFAKNAIGILNDWAATCTLVTGNSNWALAAGLTGYQFANAGELMRDYEGWDEADFQAFQSWMLRVWYEPNMKFLRVRNGTWENYVGNKGLCPGHYWSNWGLCNALSAMSIAILCDDPYLYNQAVSFYKYNHFDGDDCWPDNIIDSVIYDNGCNEFIGILVPTVFDDSRGPFGQLAQMQETGRDQGHAQMALGLAVDICQTAFNQGDDLFAYMDNRIAAGIEYQQAFNTQDEDFCATLPWMNFHYRDCRYMYYDSSSWLMTGPSYSSRGTLRPFNERILAYYEGIKGVSMPYTTAARDALGYEVGGLGSTSGGYDHLGLTTLTCHRPAIDPALASATLTGSIIADGDTLSEQTEIGGLKWTYVKETSNALPAGTELTLVVDLPDSLQGTGTWSWNTGDSGTASITVTPTRSQRYIATYTNEEGVESTAAFSVAILGDCRPDSVTPTITAYAAPTIADFSTDSITLTDNTITVLAGTDVLMQGSATSADWGYYEWEDLSTTDTLSASLLTRDRDYHLVYTNPGGAQTLTTFHICVVPMEPWVQVDSADLLSSSSVYPFAGQTVRLIPNTTETYAVGTWLWSTGDTTQVLTLDSITQSGTYTVVHSFGSLSDTLEFYVEVATAALIPDGNYHILNADDADSYLGIYTTATPRFLAYEADDHDQFVWYFERDTTLSRYKITSAYSGRYLNASTATARLSLSSSYQADRHSFSLWQGDEADCYALQVAPYYDETFLYIDDDATTFCCDEETLSGFPFRIIAAELSTGINDIAAETDGATHISYYSTAGLRLSHPTRGINIRRTTDAAGQVQTAKVWVP